MPWYIFSDGREEEEHYFKAGTAPERIGNFKRIYSAPIAQYRGDGWFCTNNSKNQ